MLKSETTIIESELTAKDTTALQMFSLSKFSDSWRESIYRPHHFDSKRAKKVFSWLCNNDPTEKYSFDAWMRYLKKAHNESN